jgi:hypothetical protein
MKVNNNKAIRSFFNRCKTKMSTDYKNDFLGIHIIKETETKIQHQMKDAGFLEFKENEEDWPSLFLSTAAFLETPYQKNISFDDIADENIILERITIPSNELFNVDSIQYDPNKELNDSMVLRALDEPYEATVLSMNDDVWMLDIYSEANTIDPFAKKAEKDVITFGLGIGYFVYMALLNEKVETITVIENNPVIIELFKKHILPQFPRQEKVSIVLGDALDYFNQETLSKYDYCFVDVYKSSDDGLIMMESLLEKYLPNYHSTDFWIEDSCLEVINALLVIYFELVSMNKKIKHNDPQYHHILKKMDYYFKGIDSTLESVEDIKSYMYNPEIAREILAISLG